VPVLDRLKHCPIDTTVIYMDHSSKGLRPREPQTVSPKTSRDERVRRLTAELLSNLNCNALQHTQPQPLEAPKLTAGEPGENQP
jgi:hypothetical protein